MSSNNRRGVIAMSVGMVSFLVNDSLVKYVSASLPAPQLIFLRGLMSSLLLLLLATALHKFTFQRTTLGLITHKWVMVRSVLDGLASLVYLTAMFNMPLANATAINMSTPLLIALFSALLLQHHASVRQWLTIGLGFVGVLMVVQPQADGFTHWAWVALAGTICHALRDMSVRYIPEEIPSTLVTFSTAVTATLMAGVWALFTPWHDVTARMWLLLASAGVFLNIGYFLLITATRDADMTVIAPFRYMGLLTAVFLGFWVWGDIPNALAWLGMGLLVAAGLIMIRISRPST